MLKKMVAVLILGLTGCVPSFRCKSNQDCAPNNVCDDGQCRANSTGSGGGNANFAGGAQAGGAQAGGDSGGPPLTALMQFGLTYPPTGIDFGDRKALAPVSGTFPNKTLLVIKNAGPMPLTGIAVSLETTSSADFALGTNLCGDSLSPNSTCQVGITFNPSTPGNAPYIRSGALNIESDNGGSLSLSLTGRSLWELKIVGPGAGVGTLATADGLCAPSATGCTQLYEPGAAVVVSAKGLNNITDNGTASRFDAWIASSPVHCLRFGYGNSCDFVMDGSREITSQWKSYTGRMVFVSSVAYPVTAAKGRDAFDGYCNDLATAAGINNVTSTGFRTIRSNQTSVAVSHIGGFQGSFIRPDGQAAGSIFGGTLAAPIFLSEGGKLLFTGANPGDNSVDVITGSLGSGVADRFGDCVNWTVSTAMRSDVYAGALGGVSGASSGGNSQFASRPFSVGNCNSMAHIYCAQIVSGSQTAAPVPIGGKVMFVSSGGFTPGMGSTTTFCKQYSPGGPSAPGTFKALLATRTMTPAQNAGLVPTVSYYRPDGAFIGTGAEITSGLMRNGLWTNQAGSIITEGFARAWTGIAANVLPNPTFLNTIGLLNSTCGDWFNEGGGGSGGTGLVNSANFDFLSTENGVSPCTTSLPLYCVEQ
jgi:hypothetical protein